MLKKLGIGFVLWYNKKINSTLFCFSRGIYREYFGEAKAGIYLKDSNYFGRWIEMSLR